ncbi:MAG TPA: septal ring lytic transglycosylase RlpA family protein [Pedomonas sp.]|uniref:septal ring lytic transglycosylase RlpA family protein n=1 Tax=Pedomonas sp. TaxID=2976421 RepID=UPI002F41B8FB
MGKGLRLCILLLTAATTTACASGHSVKATSGKPTTLAGKGSAVKPGPGGVVKIGNPYQIGDRWYYPADVPNYDETGTASWYGPQFHKKRTANGELFDMNEVSAAHPILPMPSYVEVTNLNNGRQLVVRVNDRGPFAKERIIDLSRRAAQLLGFDAQGTAPVRVRRVYPDANGKVAPAPLPQTVIAQATPQQLPQAQPQPYGMTAAVTTQQPDYQQQPAYQQQSVYPQAAPQPAPAQYASTAPVGANATTGVVTQTALPPSPYQASTPVAVQPAAVQAGIVYIQVAALSNSQRADALATQLRRFGTSLVEPAPRGIYRVKIGPFESHSSAEIVLAEIRAAGYSDARVTLRPVS